MGAHGGPGTCGWFVRPEITCPSAPVSVVVQAPGPVCIPLSIANSDSIDAGFAYWQENTLCFIADSLGEYLVTVVAIDTSTDLSDSCSFIVNVSGVKVGDETVPPGGTVRVPITLYTDQPLSGFTIPLKYSTFQPDKVTLDSVTVVPWVGDSAFIVNDSMFIVHRPIQPIPMPDSTGKLDVGYAYFTIAPTAAPETFPIDTATTEYNSVVYSYQFVTATGDTIVPLFVPGSVTIDGACSAVCGDADCSGFVSMDDIVYLINYIFANGPAPKDGREGDVDCDGRANITDAVYLVNYIFSPGSPAPCESCPALGFLEKPAIGEAELSIECSDISCSGLVLKLRSDFQIAGVQFELTTERDVYFETGATISKFSLFSNFSNGRTKIGLIDLTGSGGIPAGEHELLRWQNTGLEMPVISEAIAADRSAQPIAVRILSTAKSEVLPREFAIKQNFPNPFNPTTQIAYDVPHAEQVRIDIYNVLGQRVVTVVDAPHQPGRYSITWSGTDESGRGVASGVYLYRITAGTFVESKKMMLLK